MNLKRALPDVSGMKSVQRLEWMDWLRGASIILVVLFHVEMDTAGHLGVPIWLQRIDDAAGPFRMPAMMFLSGLLVERSLRKGSNAYLSGKVRLIAWPYIIWSIIMCGALNIAGFSLGWTPLLQVWRSPISYLWFLHSLLAFYLIAWACQRLSPWVPLTAFALLSVLGDALGNESRSGFLGVFFFAGIVASRHPVSFRPATWPTMFKCVAVAALMTSFSIGVALDGFRYQPLAIPLVAAGIAGAILVARAVLNWPLSKALQYVGRNSMVFYLVHVPVSIITTPALAATTGSGVGTIFGTVITALILSYLATEARFRWPWFNMLFAWPGKQPAKTANRTAV